MKNKKRESSWVLSFRVNLEEKNQIARLAKSSRLNISEYIRKQMLVDSNEREQYVASRCAER